MKHPIARSLLVFSPLLFFLSCRISSTTYLQRGKQAVAAGNLEEASVNLRKAIQRDSNLGEAYRELGKLDIQRGNLPAAHALLTRAVELLPKNLDAKTELGGLLLTILAQERQTNDILFDQLRKVAEELSQSPSGTFEGLRLKAGGAALKGNVFDALVWYEQANRLKPLDPRVAVPWANLLFRASRFVEAEKLCQDLIRNRKEIAPPYEFLYGRYMQSNRPGDAEAVLRMRIANNPKDGPAAIQLAAHFAQARDRNAMEAALNEILARSGDYGNGHLLVGDFYLRMQQPDLAIGMYQSGLKAHPNEKSEYLERIADALLTEGKPAEALKVVEEILTLKPDNDEARVVKASILIDSRQPDQVKTALADLKPLVAKSPANGIWRFQYGRALLANSQLEDARRQFRDTIKHRPDLLPARLALIQLSENLGDFREGLAAADDLLALNPGLPKVRLLRAVSLIGLERHGEARTELSRLRRELPGDQEVEFQLAILDLKQGKAAAAEKQFRQLSDRSKWDARALRGIAESLAAQDRDADAIRFLEARLKEFPESQAIRGLLARTQLDAGDHAGAIHNYEALAGSNAESAELRIYLGTAYQQAGKFPQALAEMEKAKAAAPAHVLPVILAAQLQDLMGRKREAIQGYRQALAMNPNDVAVMNNLAFLIAESGGSLDEAEALVRRALEKSPRAADSTDTLGWIQFKRKRFDEALQTFRSLAVKYPGNHNFRYHYGLVLLQRGDKPAAKAELQAALKSKPPVWMIPEIESALIRAN
ncbi:MAG: tetratricopeptide repeat protein [Bryobacterales bacterium]|nr:tetratricopeptide repeat protein [Bryobacterales bacterium]